MQNQKSTSENSEKITNLQFQVSKVEKFNDILQFQNELPKFPEKISFLDVPFKRYHRRCFLETRCDTSVFE